MCVEHFDFFPVLTPFLSHKTSVKFSHKYEKMTTSQVVTKTNCHLYRF